MAKLLRQTLEKEKQTDVKLTEVTQSYIMPAAMSGESEEEEEEESAPRRTRSRTSAGGRPHARS